MNLSILHYAEKMEQRDYIKRQIEQIGIMLERMLSTLFGLRSGGNTGSAVRQLCGEFKEELDIDIDTLIPADQDTVIRVLQAKGFDYDMLIRLRSVIDGMASSLQDGDPAKDGLTALSEKLGTGTQAAYSTADFSDFQ